ncbi:hypothetical protein Pfo_028289, partial [Paulownia fortunei]
EKVPYFSSANISRIYLGNHAFKQGLNDKPTLLSALNAMELLQNAINEAGYGDLIKATLPHPEVILKNKTRPSEAEFRDEIKEEIVRFVRFLQETNAPFVIELFPIEYVTQHNLDPSFSFPDNKSTHVVGCKWDPVHEFIRIHL